MSFTGDRPEGAPGGPRPLPPWLTLLVIVVVGSLICGGALHGIYPALRDMG